MSQYTKSTNFATKDNLSPGDPLKIVRGTEIDTEFNNISTAISTKTDNSAAAITGGSISGITDLAIADGGTGASTATAAINNLLPSQTSNANKYLQTDGTNVSWDAVSLSTSDITGTLPVANGGTGITSFGTGVATFLGTPSSANLASAVTDETGSGALVFANTPTLVAPILGTPTSGNFSSGSFTWPTFNQNTTGTAAGLSATLAIASGGTGQTTANAAFNALAPSQTSASGKYLKSDGTNTSWDALDISTADITGTLPVANGGTGVTSSTGTGNVVLSNSPTLVTPILGTPQSGNFSTGTFTWPTFNQNTTGTAAGLSATLATTSGGTGLTSFTSGGVVYASSTSALATGSMLVFDSSDRLIVGAGSASIGHRIESVAVSNGASIAIRGRASDTYGYLSWHGNTSATEYARIGSDSTSSLFFGIGSSGTTALTLTSTSLYTASGINVGIGTSSPAQKLHTNVASGGVYNQISSGSNNVYIGFDSSRTVGTIQSNNALTFDVGSSYTERMRLDSAGNLGLGVTPSAWGSTYTALQVENFGLMAKDDSNWLYSNAYFNGTSNLYTGNGYAGIFDFNGHVTGGYVLRIAPSGSAGGSASFTQVLAVEKDKSLALQGASSASGAGITFPATQSASSDANTLDDYEEGTWTPTVSGGYTGVTYTTQNGYYTKIGRLVNLVCYVYFSGTADGAAIQVSNLPFQLVGGGNCGTVGYWDVTTDGNLSAWIGGTQNVIFYKVGTSSAAISTGNVTNKFIIFSITGFV